jgi:hypothetical protein
MLTDKSKALLQALEAKYVTMLGMVSDIGRIDMGDVPEQTELEKYILNQQQEIHEAASRLNYGK